MQNATLIPGEDSQGFAYQSTTTHSQAPTSANSYDGGLCGGDGDNVNDGAADVWLTSSKTNPTNSRRADDDGDYCYSRHPGALVIGGTCVAVGGACRGDVIGCYLDLDARLAYWTINGVTSPDMTLSIALFPSQTVFYPSIAIQVSLRQTIE